MKCKRTYCHKEAAKNQVYCSRDCAPYGNYVGDLTHYPYRSEYTTGKSFITGPGEASKAPSIDAKQSKYEEADLKIDSKKMLGKRSAIGKTRKNIDYRKESPRNLSKTIGQNYNRKRSIEKGPQKKDGNMLSDSIKTTENESSKKLKSVNEMPIPAMGSTKPSININEASSEVMSLLKESTTLLFDVMNSNKDKPAVVCNCASEIHKLIRLKLDIIKTAIKH